VTVVAIAIASLMQCFAASHICTCSIMCWRWMWQAELNCRVALRLCVHAAGPSRLHRCVVLLTIGVRFISPDRYMAPEVLNCEVGPPSTCLRCGL
jgi:hypothetical protein